MYSTLFICIQYQSDLTTTFTFNIPSFQFKYYVKFTNVPELYILFVILSINIWIKKGFCVCFPILTLEKDLKNDENVERSEKEFLWFYLRHKSCLKLTFGGVKRVDVLLLWKIYVQGTSPATKRPGLLSPAGKIKYFNCQ